MNTIDQTTETHTHTHTGEETTLLGGDVHAPDPAVRAKNKGNLVLFIVLGVLLIAVLGAGYMAFGKHHAAAPAAAFVSPPAAANHQAVLAPAHPATTHTVAPLVTTPVAAVTPEPTKLTSPDEAQALLGAAPPVGTAAVTPPAALPSQAIAPASGLPVNPLLGSPTPAEHLPPSLSAPIVATPTLGLPATPAVAATSALSLPSAPALGANPSPIVTAAPETVPTVITPAPSSTTAVTEVTEVAPPSNQLDGRVTRLETDVRSIQARQSHILNLLNDRPSRPTHEKTNHLSNPLAAEKPRHRARRSLPVNTVELVKDKTVSHSSEVSPREAPACHLASIVPNRAWTKLADGTFLTYGVGDRAPNGAVIKSIDPSTGILTDKGKLNCAMTD